MPRPQVANWRRLGRCGSPPATSRRRAAIAAGRGGQATWTPRWPALVSRAPRWHRGLHRHMGHHGNGRVGRDGSRSRPWQPPVGGRRGGSRGSDGRGLPAASNELGSPGAAGARSVAVARATPGVRIVAIAASALAGMPGVAFVTGLAVGNALFISAHFGLGYLVGEPIVQALGGALGPIAIVAVLLLGLRRHRLDHHRSTSTRGRPSPAARRRRRLGRCLLSRMPDAGRRRRPPTESQDPGRSRPLRRSS